MTTEKRITEYSQNELANAFYDAMSGHRIGVTGRPDIDEGCYSYDRGLDHFAHLALSRIVEEMAKCTPLWDCAFRDYINTPQMIEDLEESIRLAGIDADGNWQSL